MTEVPPVETAPAGALDPRSPFQRSFERSVSTVLLGGVLLSAAIAGVGVVDLLLRAGRAIDTAPVHFDPGSFVGSLAVGDAYAILLLGLLVLVATPFVRVVLSVVEFARAGDRAFVAMTIFALAMLAFVAVWGGRP